MYIYTTWTWVFPEGLMSATKNTYYVYIHIIPLGLGVSRGVDERDQEFDHLPQLNVSICTSVPVKQVN
jgi:hypothetical protein